MAYYTQSLREILQQHQTAEQSLMDVNDVYDLSSAYLFDKMPQGVISDEFRQRFITGFTLRFMEEELGLESLSLWKVKLNEKIYNYGTYINSIFENLDKEIFADYKVSRGTKSGTASGNKTKSDSLSSQRDIDGSESNQTTKDATNVTTFDTSDVLDSDATSELVKSGSELTSKGGKDALNKLGAESRHKGGDDTTEKMGSETRRLDGSDIFKKRGEEISENSGGETTIQSSGSDNRVNAANVVFDAPMGSLSNMRSVTYDGSIQETSGTPIDTYSIGGNNVGAAFEENNVYNYMSAANETGQTTLNVENSQNRTDNDLKTTTSFDDREDETEYGKKEITQFGKNDATADARKDVTEYNSSDDVVYGTDINGNVSPRSDETVYGSKDTVTFGKKWNGTNEIDDARSDLTTSANDETRTKTGTESLAIDDTTSGSKTTSSTDSLTQTGSGTETTSDTRSDTENVTDYNINLEMLYRSMPLLNKVWEIFDDLFMLIF